MLKLIIGYILGGFGAVFIAGAMASAALASATLDLSVFEFVQLCAIVVVPAALMGRLLTNQKAMAAKLDSMERHLISMDASLAGIDGRLISAETKIAILERRPGNGRSRILAAGEG